LTEWSAADRTPDHFHRYADWIGGFSRSAADNQHGSLHHNRRSGAAGYGEVRRGFTNAAHTFTNLIDSVKLPTVDMTEPVARYFEFLQGVVEFNRDLATHWAGLVITLSGSVREQVEQVSSIVRDQTDTFANRARQPKNA